MSDDIRNEQYLSKFDVCRPADSGEMKVQNCGVKPPMPCIVILVHGVNDVGEAFENQDKGICKGLNERLGRTDLHAHAWKPHEFMISDVDGNLRTETCSLENQTCIGVVNRSPVIPFYWGYKPVDKATWEADQQRYREDILKKKPDPDLPYDTYQQNEQKIIHAHNGANIDNLNNWLDLMYAKGGGTFANATTSIPDMFGPGANGPALELVGEFSRSRWGDWTHPVYSNPHRIYQAFAARRLADLILAIRRNPKTSKDTINIVAHSQGTLVTMLANMWVHAEGLPAADCVILNNSPYSLQNRWLENAQPGNQQTDKARQGTLKNFCHLMYMNSQYNAGQSHPAGDVEKLFDEHVLSREGKKKWAQNLYNRNNFGLVYNYFCPNDQVVSMLPIQGMGWRGIPDSLGMGKNLRQRAFCKDVLVGGQPGEAFKMPAAKANDQSKPIQDVSYSYEDVTVSGEALPASFAFKLQGQDGIGEQRYMAEITGNDPEIAKAAIHAENFRQEVVEVPATPDFKFIRNGQALSAAQLKEIRDQTGMDVIGGKVQGEFGQGQKLLVKRYLTDDEMKQMLKKGSSFSQHSSIVCSKDVQEKVVPFDLAIGSNAAFEDKEFWERLLLQADWRRPVNPDPKVKEYYQTGNLPLDFKQLMNKPEHVNGMPIDDSFGVVNDFGPRQRVNPGSKRDVENQVVSVHQWDFPKPQV